MTEKENSLKEGNLREHFMKEMEGFNYTGWTIDNLNPYLIFNQEQLEHVTVCLRLLVKEFLDKPSYDGFIEALSKENYKEAMMLADDINSVAIKIYAIFISTFVPLGLIKK